MPDNATNPEASAAVVIPPLDTLDPARFETTEILKRLNSASRMLAELKGVAASLPNQDILINSLGLQEAKDSSAIENIVTTHDELFRDSLFPEDVGNSTAKEVLRYGQSLRVGWAALREHGLLTTNHIVAIQAVLERRAPGFRKVPGTILRNDAGVVVYTPPGPEQIDRLMGDLERFINDTARFPADPLVKMALIHQQFESIHPFYDGNGRTGRIVNVLYLVQQGLLDSPVLYMSRYILRTRSEYYRLLRAVREDDAWHAWVVYVLTAVEETAREAIGTVRAIRDAVLDVKHVIRANYKFYSQDLINSLFSHPYTRIRVLERDLGVSRVTAMKYLEALTAGGLLQKRRTGRSNYYINTALFRILAGTLPPAA